MVKLTCKNGGPQLNGKLKANMEKVILADTYKMKQALA